MTCKIVSQKIDSYLDGELTGFEMQAVRSHLYDCAACAEEAESFRSLKSALMNLPAFSAPEGLEERLMQSVRSQARPAIQRRSGLFWGSALATASAAGFLAVWLTGSFRGGPSEPPVASTSQPRYELKRDQIYDIGADPISGQSMVVTAAYGGSANGQ